MRAMTAKAARNSRSKASVSLTLAAVARQATGTPSPSVAMWYLVPLLPRSVGLGPVRSPPRLARTEQVSRIRSGWPRSIVASSACTFAAICREYRVSRKVVRKVIRSQATEFRYERSHQPLPRIDPWRKQLDDLLLANEGKP